MNPQLDNPTTDYLGRNKDDRPRRNTFVNYVGTVQFMAPECIHNKPNIGFPGLTRPL